MTEATYTTTDRHDSTEYHPNEVTTTPIQQEYNADNASTSNNYNDAAAEVQADSSAVGSTYGSNVYKPDLSSAGVSLVITPSVTKTGTMQGGMTTSAAKEVPWLLILGAGITLATVVYLYRRAHSQGW